MLTSYINHALTQNIDVNVPFYDHGKKNLRERPFSPTNGRDQVKTSMKFGNQYGCGEQLNCRIFITLFSYFNMAAEISN